MGEIVREQGFHRVLDHHDPDAYAIGFFEFQDHEILPARLTIQTQIVFTQGDDTGPHTAAIGLVDVEFLDEEQEDIHANPDDPRTWVPFAFGRIRRWRSGAHVCRGSMAGSVMVQIWDN